MKLSIITVNLNDRLGLEKTLESVVYQTFKDYEHIVIDGGSTDGSSIVIDTFKNNLAFYLSEPDSGIYNAMNKGLSQAKGEYCLFLNSGDWLINQEVLKKVFSIGYSEDILFGSLNVIKSGKKIGIATTPRKLTLQSLYKGTIHHQAAFIHKSLFEKYGYYNENYRIRADWDFWLRAIIIYNCSYRNIEITISNYDADGFSSKPSIKNDFVKETSSILQALFPQNILKDYTQWEKKIEELEPLFWVKSKKYLYYPLVRIHKLSKIFFNKNSKSS